MVGADPYEALCNGIAASVDPSCKTSFVGGFKDRLIIIPFEAIDRDPLDVSGMKITQIALKSGKVAYYIRAKKYAHVPTSEFVPNNKGEDRWKHVVGTVIQVDDVESKTFLNQLAGHRYVVIAEKNVASGNEKNAFEVYGYDSGMWLTASSINSQDGDSKGAYVVSLESNEMSLELFSPRTFDVGTYANTQTAVESLLIPAV